MIVVDVSEKYPITTHWVKDGKADKAMHRMLSGSEKMTP